MAEGLSITLRQAGPIALNVDIEVALGQTLALVGASGAGKTTVLRSIAGLYRPRHGQITCNGQAWLDTANDIDLPARARRTGFVYQSYALFPHLSALANVMEAILARPRPERRRRACKLLAQVHLEGFDDRLPASLSGGQQQRVALARALARDPQVLLLDEPFSAVDHPTRRALHALLAEIRTVTTMPIIFVSHDVEDAGRCADRICYMRDGTSVEEGPTRSLLDRPNGQLSSWLNNGL